ncbi:MAG: cell division topological specificity factor MinE [Neisseriales bacterium]|nr:MAG: cell division topological specificity factor MinE [Neisseriales bacterium]
MNALIDLILSKRHLIFGRRQSSANIARERLQIILAHERGGRSAVPDYLPALQRDLVKVIAKYVAVDQDNIKVEVQSHDNTDVLAVNIVLGEAESKLNH